MTADNNTVVDIKYRLMHRFYGIETYVDLPTELPSMIDTLDASNSEINLYQLAKELDLWFLSVSNVENTDLWNCLEETLQSFTQRNGEIVIAHLMADKQYNDSDIVGFLKSNGR